MYQFTEEEREIYESQNVPMAIYDVVDGHTVTLLVSNGLCRSAGFTREQLTARLTDNMVAMVHPDDVGHMTNIGARFVRRETPYDVLYRVRTNANSNYHPVHAVGYWQRMQNGQELAFVYYTNIAESSKTIHWLTDDYHSTGREDFYRDAITGLPNMNFLHLFINEKISMIESSGGQPLVALININGMRSYNDKYGYEAGDRMLKQLADILRDLFKNSFLVRGFDDHFVIICDGEGIEQRLNEAHNLFRRQVVGNTRGFQAGICKINGDITGKKALDRAKRAVQSIHDDYSRLYAFYCPKIDADYWDQRYVLSNFERALSEKWIKVFYQCIVRPETGKVAYLESLARWVDPERGTLPPNKFIPVLEKYNLIYRLDMYMINQACREIHLRREAGLDIVPVSINLSGRDFDSPDIVDDIIATVKEHGINHRKLIFEVTEQALPAWQGQIREKIDLLRANGFRVWVDDFGSGYSSLSVFNRYKFDLLKLDRALIRDLDEGEGANRLIISSIVYAAHKLGLMTLAEGPETEEQIAFLREIKCDLIQSYMYHRPEPLCEIKQRKSMGGIILTGENDEEAEMFENRYTAQKITGGGLENFIKPQAENN